MGLDCFHVMLFYMQCVFNFACTGISIKNVYRQHFHHILSVISVLTYNCNNENEKFIEPNELSILICQICYKTNSKV